MVATNVLLVLGKPSTGKSKSLEHFRNPKEVGYLNCDRKVLPFSSKKVKFLANITVHDPEDILDYIDIFEDKDELKIGVIDTITDLMKEYKIRYVDDAADTRAAWGNYQKFYNKIISRIKSSSKTWVILAHVHHSYDESKEEDVSNMVIQGGAGKSPISDYTVVVEADSKALTKKMEKIDTDLFSISETERLKGIKYYFITTRTKADPATLARSSDDMWKLPEEVYIDNNVQNVLDVMEDFYSE